MKRLGYISALPLLLCLLIAFAVLIPASESVEAQDNPTIPPTLTPRGFVAESTATPAPTETAIPSLTASPTATEAPSLSPTPTQPVAFTSEGLPPTPTVFYPPEFTPAAQATAIPTAMPRLLPRAPDDSRYEVINIALIGNDSESIDQATGVFRTDTMIIVNINLTTQTVSMLSLPRDLVVWIAGWQMQRLNLAWGWGESVGWTDGGWGLFRQTVLYNFGIELHYFALVDFTGFKTIIDMLDGVTIAVDCPIQGYLFTDEYDADNQPIFELTTLPVGVHNLNSTQALWYARTRRNSSDFDRGRRQQQVLRAIFNEGRDLGMVTEFPTLWEQMNQIVQTNLPLSAVIELIPVALQLQPNDIENHFFRLDIETTSWTTPTGENVQVPNPSGAMISLIQNFLTPPTVNQVVEDASSITIYDGSGMEAGWDVVASERLVWDGLLGTPAGAYSDVVPKTIVIDYTGATKGSSLETLVEALNVNPSDVQFQPDPNRTTDFEVILGQDYNSCVDRQVQAVENIAPVTATPSGE